MSNQTLTLLVTDKRTTDAQGNVLVDKNGTPYCVLEFSTPDTKYIRNAKGEMKAVACDSVSVGGYSAWEKSNLASKKGKADFGWKLEIGQELVGTIAKRRVEPYFIADGPNAKKPGPDMKDGKTGRMVGTASVITFADSSSPEELELDIQEQFRRKGHKLMGSTVEQVDMLNERNITDATAGTKVIDEQAAVAA